MILTYVATIFFICYDRFFNNIHLVYSQEMRSVSPMSIQLCKATVCDVGPTMEIVIHGPTKESIFLGPTIIQNWFDLQANVVDFKIIRENPMLC